MEKRTIARVGMTLCFLSTVVIILCVVADAEKIKAEDVSVTKEGLCVYPQSPAFVLGLVAFFFLLVVQVVTSVVTLFLCRAACSAPSSFLRFSSSLLFFLSWVTFALAMMDLREGAMVNKSKYLPKTPIFEVQGGKDSDGICLLGETTLFLRAAILSGITLLLSLLSFVFNALAIS